LIHWYLLSFLRWYTTPWYLDTWYWYLDILIPWHLDAFIPW
jgi:hypothetical protein